MISQFKSNLHQDYSGKPVGYNIRSSPGGISVEERVIPWLSGTSQDFVERSEKEKVRGDFIESLAEGP